MMTELFPCILSMPIFSIEVNHQLYILENDSLFIRRRRRRRPSSFF